MTFLQSLIPMLGAWRLGGFSDDEIRGLLDEFMRRNEEEDVD